MANIPSKWITPASNLVLSHLPARLRNALCVRKHLLDAMLVHGGRRGFFNYANSQGYRHQWLKDEPDQAGGGSELAGLLGKALLEMKERQRDAPPAYMPAQDWAAILAADWAEPLAQVAAGDFAGIEPFLQSFFRNGGISGFWGHRGMFEQFANENKWTGFERLLLFLKQCETWRREVPDGNLDELDQPRVGNPWGYNLNGRLLIEPAFEYHALALQVKRLLAGIAKPVIVEIGGGFGGLARQLLRLVPGARYVGIDLPENVVIQSWYLTRSLPDRRVTFNAVAAASDRGLNDTDAVLLPNLSLPSLRLSCVDIVINVRSFGEMSRSTLDAYFAEVIRLDPQWILHENLASPRRDSLYGISSDAYPALTGYRLIASAESRWPRYDHRIAYPCREHLFQCSNTTL